MDFDDWFFIGQMIVVLTAAMLAVDAMIRLVIS